MLGCILYQQQMSLSPSTQEIKIKELTFLEIEEISLQKYASKHPSKICYKPYSLKQSDSTLAKLQGTEMFSFRNPDNQVLEAFSYILLRTIYGRDLDEDLLKMVKINLYSDEIDLKNIKNDPLSFLPSEHMKKLIVEFIFELCFSDFHQALGKKLQKHPVVLQILSIFLRCTLCKFGVEEANSFTDKLPTETVVELLGDYYDLNYHKNGDSYFFIERNIFLSEINNQIVVGNYSQTGSNQKAHQQKKPVKQEDNPERSQTKESTHKLSKIDLRKNSMDDCSRFSIDAPTPFFNANDTGFNFKGKKEEEVPFSLPKHKAYNYLLDNSLIEEQHPNGNNPGTPSVCSLEDQLQKLNSPAFSDRSAGNSAKNKDQNRFAFATALNEEYFMESNILDNYQQADCLSPQKKSCDCKKIAKMSLSFNSNIYSMKISEKPKSTFGQYSLSSRENFKKNKNEFQNCATERKGVPSFIKTKKQLKHKNITKTEESEDVDSPSNYSMSENFQFNKINEGPSNRSSKACSISEEPPLMNQVPPIRFIYSNK